ncbi:MAG: N-acetylmuramoyl-L-alanine amidase, partial [Lachnospiraceae bacterium]|nr:N-acetylmuramoyl-L-alanine amidase [Lachnospiraceae bacterium]
LSTLGSNSKGLVAGDEIYIIRTSNVPVALAEVGFITNKEELEKMVSEEYQQKAAQSLYDAIITTLKENGKL